MTHLPLGPSHFHPDASGLTMRHGFVESSAPHPEQVS